ncbi:hypothetical protein GCM10022229_00280 [Luteimonas lutimaris]|uniref:DUF1318 domain-containing protein n=2 Tax=Luteimonas lutimaris TaxID=698645 RepID=A0ABP7LZK5_9GAMM
MEGEVMKGGTKRAGLAGMLFALVALALAGTAQAGNDDSRRIADIVSEQQQIRADAEAERNGWDNIPLLKRQELITTQDELMRLIDGKQTLGDLDPLERKAAYRTLDRLDALALEAENERMVCIREKLTGTHRTQTVCRSVGDMKRWRKGASDFMRQGQQNSTMGAQAGAN